MLAHILAFSLLMPLAPPSPVSVDTLSLPTIHPGPPAQSMVDSLPTAPVGSNGRPLLMPTTDIRATRVARPAEELAPSTALVDRILADGEDLSSVADLGRLAPSVWTVTNSRGESLFQLRGSSERHIGVLLEGIPLTVPWDERADLSLIPAEALGRVRLLRGVGSVLQRPNAVAGQVELELRRLGAEGKRTAIEFRGGEAGAWKISGHHLRRSGNWDLVTSLGQRAQNAFLLPEDLSLEFNQGVGQARTNSDLRSGHFLLYAARRPTGGSRVGLLLAGYDAEKGVAPEGHTAEARFWRYPQTRRLLVGTHADGRRGKTEWGGHLSVDFFEQTIQEFDDARYATPTASREENHDRSLDLGLRAGHNFEKTTLKASAGFRATQHRESPDPDSDELEYSQSLAHAATELAWNPQPNLAFQLGAGIDFQETPDSGDKPKADQEIAPNLSLRAARQFSTRDNLEFTAWHRSRFASLRELYSGALGRFVLNEELGPEKLTGVQLGWQQRRRSLDLYVGGFHTYLDGAIEKVSLGGGQFQRANSGELRSTGLEFSSTWRPLPGLRVILDQSLMHHRLGDGSVKAEDRPEMISGLSLNWLHPSGWMFRAEGELIGARSSADASVAKGRVDLPIQGRINLRGAWRWFRGAGPGDMEFSLRLDNALDQRVDSQVGLPQAGRTLWAGIRLGYGNP